jgi:aminoglycoside phosphotransferase (APT) family kinase protein
VTYGYGISDELHRRLRGAVAPEALEWVERETGCRVLTQRPLEGGTSAAIHRLVLDGCDDVVLQRFVLDWISEEPWAVSNEVAVLGLLADAGVPSPLVVAADPDGSLTGVPTVLMTALPGRVVWDPPDVDDWLRSLVDTMIAIQKTPTSGTLREWYPYAPEGVPPPSTRHRWAWERAISVYTGDQPASDVVFVHRDFHPGNVLWECGRVSGVVDWVSSCVGPPEEDVAHCRVNLAGRHGQPIADRFLDLWLQSTGRTEYDPYWDLVDAVSMGGGNPKPRLDEFVAAAAARL